VKADENISNTSTNINRPPFIAELIAKKKHGEESEENKSSANQSTTQRPAFLNELIARRKPEEAETTTDSTNRPAFLNELIARRKPEEAQTSTNLPENTRPRPAFLNELIGRKNPEENESSSSQVQNRPRPAFLSELTSRVKADETEGEDRPKRPGFLNELLGNRFKQGNAGGGQSTITGEVKKKLKSVFIEKMNPENLKGTIYGE